MNHFDKAYFVSHLFTMEVFVACRYRRSQEEMGTGRHWTDHENRGWGVGMDGFEIVAYCMVEKLRARRRRRDILGRSM